MKTNYCHMGNQFFGDIDQMINFIHSYNVDQVPIQLLIDILEETKKQGYYLSNEKEFTNSVKEGKVSKLLISRIVELYQEYDVCNSGSMTSDIIDFIEDEINE